MFAMSGAEIAEAEGVSRQAISQTLKRGLVKAYNGLKRLNKTDPFETAADLAVGLGVDATEYKKFFRMFPPKVREEIENDAKKLIRF